MSGAATMRASKTVAIALLVNELTAIALEYVGWVLKCVGWNFECLNGRSVGGMP
ncbi:hypothetical protein FVEN_g13183 [Fusarium venenatum]|nr:hypothetical protein FVEN_g13183 [Fusarium venenatum]